MLRIIVSVVFLAVVLWLILMFLYKPIGMAVSKIWSAFKKEVGIEEEENKNEENG